MKLDTHKCQQHDTEKHLLPTGGLAITFPDGRLVAYRKQATNTWQWIRKGFQFFGKKKG